MPPLRLAIFDCDSTLSAIEGIDELARARGAEVFRAAAAMTEDAMNGKIRVEDVFARRLALIRPSRREVDTVARLYVEQVEPTARETVATLRQMGWTPIILSGGFRPVIRPLADFLGIDRIEAVDLRFDAAGEYAGFDEAYPTTRSGGKPQRIGELKRELAPERTVMVGDGVSDLEAAPVVDLFVGFGRYAERAKVKSGSRHFIRQLADLPPILP